MTQAARGPEVDSTGVLSLPRSCWGCQVLLSSTSQPPHLCLRCDLGISPLDPSLYAGEAIRALYPYQGVMARLLTQLKFQGNRASARPLGELFAQAWARAQPRRDPLACLVTIPLHWKRRMHRGFNQCELILSWAKIEAGPSPLLLSKTRATPAQRGLRREDRQRNLEGSFVVNAKAKVQPGASIWVIDDVTTTGATLRAAIQTLKDAGYTNCRGVALMQA